MSKTRPFDIPKQLVWEAYKRVKANKGAAGVDGMTLEDFEKDRTNNLYKLWNRMSSGTYFPPAVLAVPIPKKDGGRRVLGIPTVIDRIAQMVVKLTLEPKVERHFLPDSYGYRPNKTAHMALETTRRRCWKYDWVLEYDIKGLFDHIPHDLLLKAVDRHVTKKWEKLYIERWLKAAVKDKAGNTSERTTGTPQGGVISPLLSNLFLHYAIDIWLTRQYPSNPWCRYADDGLIHCKTKEEAIELQKRLQERLEECGLTMHPEKTKIIYCKDSNRKGRHDEENFDFLGYTFRPRQAKNSRTKKSFTTFSPAVAKTALNSMRRRIRQSGLRNRTDLNLLQIAMRLNPIIRGWINYYGVYNQAELRPLWRYLNQTLAAWAKKKFKKLRRRKVAAMRFIRKIADENMQLFAHWKLGTANRSV